ncbi:M48 family metalloprotease [Hamadaea sp. NPDC051192]|uniref:M48 family metalloprotease n=1 Tax=Hamadaea sp. NPDC051192 TaxID=3154940 RepID=UPI00342CC09B
MFCDQCGGRVDPAATVCPHCQALLEPLPVAVPAPRAPADDVRRGGDPPAVRRRAHLPPARTWFAFLRWEHAPATAISIFCAWFGVPFVLLMAMLGAIVGGLAGTVQGTFAGPTLLARLDTLMTWAVPLPVHPIDLLPTAAIQIGGVVGGVIGAVNGARTLGWLAFAWPWQSLYAGDPTWPFLVGFGQIAVALFFGTVTMMASTAFDRFGVLLSGGRRLSRREDAWLSPMLAEVARDMGIARPPVLLVTEDRGPRAYTTIRSIVISRGLVDELERDRRAIMGVLAHELSRWHHGDATAAAWIKGCGFPLYLLHEVAYRLLRVARWRPIQWLLRSVLWSVLATVRYIVRPVWARGMRKATYRADADARAAGHGEGLRRALARIGIWESALDGWDEVMSTSHPHIELRMERLEIPGRIYPPHNEFSLVGPRTSLDSTTSHMGEP